MRYLSKTIKSPLLRQCGSTIPIRHFQHSRAPSFSRVLASSTLATPPEQIRPLPSSRPRLTLPPDTEVSIEQYKRDVTVEIDGEPHSYDAFFLRDLCPCPKCVDSSTRQKLFNTTDLPDDIIPRAIRIKSKGSLEIIWSYPENHPHVSHYDPELLIQYSTSERRRHFRFPMPKQVYWDGEIMKENILRIDYEAFMKDDEMLHRLLVQLQIFGLAYFVNVPSVNTDGGEITKLVERIGEVKQTFYGKTWDVKSVPQSKNIAYSPRFHGLTTDIRISI